MEKSKTLNNKINFLLEQNHLEYYKDGGEYWIISEVLKGQYFYYKLRYCTNARTKRDFLTWLTVRDLPDLYERLK